MGGYEKPDAITREALIIVEGKDEMCFLEAFLKYKKMQKDIVQILDAGGKANIKNNLYDLRNLPGFEKVRKLAIIRDADSNPDAAFQSVNDSLKEINFPQPSAPGNFSHPNQKPIIGVFISPNNSDSGCLESLLIDHLGNPNYLNCIKEMFDCAKRNEDHKNIMLAYLSLMPKYCNSVGIGAKKQYFNFESLMNSELSSFIDNFAQK